MPFIGTQPEVGGYSVLDALSASATENYTLQLNSANFSPASANQLLVSLNGVIQKPGSSFTVSGSTLSFSSALTSSDSIDFIIAMGEPLLIGTPSDGTVTTNKLVNDSVTGAKIENNPTIAGNLTVSGTSTLTGATTLSSNVGVNGGTGGQIAANYSTASTTGLSLNDTNSGNLGGFLSFKSGGTLRGNIQNANNAGIHVNVGNGSVVFTQTGYVAANALDDYEEGTWTPIFTNKNSSATQGSYTKVGNFVTCTFDFQANGTNTDVNITGVPFAMLVGAGQRGGGLATYQNRNSTEVWTVIPVSSTAINFYHGAASRTLTASETAIGTFSFFTTS